MITFELISPFELSRTDAYKDISLLTECVLNLLSHTKLSNESESQPDPQPDVTDQDKVERTVKFEDKQKTVSSVKKTVSLSDGDIKLYSNFIAYSIQWLFVAEKWENMVDLADLSSKQLLTICTDPDDELLFLLAYLLQFRIYAENKLYEVAKTKTEQVKYALKIRIEKSNIGKRLLNKSKSSAADRRAAWRNSVQARQISTRKKKLSIFKCTKRYSNLTLKKANLLLIESEKCKQHQRKPQTMKKVLQNFCYSNEGVWQRTWSTCKQQDDGCKSQVSFSHDQHDHQQLQQNNRTDQETSRKVLAHSKSARNRQSLLFRQTA